MSNLTGNPVHEAVDELETLLNLISTGVAPSRAHAMAYSRCRSILLGLSPNDRLPGFLTQCGSIYKFREFITLYHARVASRHSFLDSVFDRCRAVVDEGSL